MCEAFSNAGYNVTLFVGGTSDDNSRSSLSAYYGVDYSDISIEIVKGEGRGLELRIALLSMYCFLTSIFKKHVPEMIFSRNLYAAFFFAYLLKRKVVYESHSPDTGFRKLLQKMVITRKRVTTVVISEALKTVLMEHHDLDKACINVFHDAAPSGRNIQPKSKREGLRKTLYEEVGITDNSLLVGYFGHLYSGRGLEVIQAMAAARPRVTFLVFGGNESDISKRRKNNKLNNLYFGGYIAHNDAIQLMSAMDILLMPYQRQVSIGISGHDTAKWMSPMKMFEYLAAGVPIISSNLPVLTEILHNGENALLVPPDDYSSWIEALDTLINKPSLAASLAKQGHEDYASKYTWDIRSRNIIDAMTN